jgi:hypothetical protein
VSLQEEMNTGNARYHNIALRAHNEKHENMYQALQKEVR